MDEVDILRMLASRQELDSYYARGYTKLYIDHVTRADRCCDFDFLEGSAITTEFEIN